jgi:hypothetical protein
MVRDFITQSNGHINVRNGAGRGHQSKCICRGHWPSFNRSRKMRASRDGRLDTDVLLLAKTSQGRSGENDSRGSCGLTPEKTFS